MKHISSIKPTVEKGLYGLVKRPDAKTPDLSELSKTIKKFQDTPDDHFTSRLRKRVPSNSSFKLESKDDFGLSKRFKSGSLTKVESPDASAKIVDSRFSDNSKPFKISQGITGLNKQFQKVLPKTDYTYTDPQYYEYKLKGQTIKDQQLSAFKNQNENDIDKLDVQGKYKKWRQDDLEKKATSIQKMVRGRSIRENLSEGMDGLDGVKPETLKQADVRDIIAVGKANRNIRNEQTREGNKTIRKEIQDRTKELEELYNEEKKYYAATTELNKRAKQHKKDVKHNQFLEESGIGEYAAKGQAAKEQKIEAREKAALKLQKLTRGKISRKNPINNPYSEERVGRKVGLNPDYDPRIKDQLDTRSHKDLYYKPEVTEKERRKIEENFEKERKDRKRSAKKQLTEAQLQDRKIRLEELSEAARFLDKDERPLTQRLTAAYSRKAEQKEEKQRTSEDPRRAAWLKKQDEINDNTKDQMEEEKQHRQHSTDVDNYQSLMELLQTSKSGSKTTKEMNKLISSVYESFGKNAGTNTNRKVSTVIRQLETWQAEKEAKQEKIAAHNAQLSAKKAKANKAKQDDAKRRLPPSTSVDVHTLESLKEQGGGGAEYSMDRTNTNKKNLIPQPKKANTINNYFSPKNSKK